MTRLKTRDGSRVLHGSEVLVGPAAYIKGRVGVTFAGIDTVVDASAGVAPVSYARIPVHAAVTGKGVIAAPKETGDDWV